MSKIVVEQFINGVIRGIKNHLGTRRNALARRITVLLLILYSFAMVNVGRYIVWGPVLGLTWTSSGYSLFPIPFNLLSLGYVVTPVFYHLNALDMFIYVVFIGQWFWVAWMSLGILYIMMPLVRRGYFSLGTFNSKPEQKPSDIVEPVSLFTKLTSVLTVLLSTGTFIVNLAVYGPLLLSIVLGLSIVVFWILFVENRKAKPKKIIREMNLVSMLILFP